MQTSCSKKIEGRTDNAPALNPSNLDIDAGSWKTVLIKGQIHLRCCASCNKYSAYIAEINEIKGYQQKILQQIKSDYKILECPVLFLRWNEILRNWWQNTICRLIKTKMSTYPIPNSLNPLIILQFPFSNPPFAARAYGYISAAQYDALVAAWHYKNYTTGLRHIKLIPF